jgi:hypothetical protein
MFYCVLLFIRDLFVQAFHYVCETCLSSNADSQQWPVHLRDLRKLHGWTEVDFRNLLSINEFMIPTCSYRMGTNTIGYGVAVIRELYFLLSFFSFFFMELWLDRSVYIEATGEITLSCTCSVRPMDMTGCQLLVHIRFFFQRLNFYYFLSNHHKRCSAVYT